MFFGHKCAKSQVVHCFNQKIYALVEILLINRQKASENDKNPCISRISAQLLPTTPKVRYVSEYT